MSAGLSWYNEQEKEEVRHWCAKPAVVHNERESEKELSNDANASRGKVPGNIVLFKKVNNSLLPASPPQTDLSRARQNVQYCLSCKLHTFTNGPAGGVQFTV